MEDLSLPRVSKDWGISSKMRWPTYLHCYRLQMEVAKRGADDQTVVVKPRDLCHCAIDDVKELWDFEEMTSSACCSDLRAFAACDTTTQ